MNAVTLQLILDENGKSVEWFNQDPKHVSLSDKQLMDAFNKLALSACPPKSLNKTLQQNNCTRFLILRDLPVEPNQACDTF